MAEGKNNTVQSLVTQGNIPPVVAEAVAKAMENLPKVPNLPINTCHISNNNYPIVAFACEAVRQNGGTEDRSL